MIRPEHLAYFKDLFKGRAEISWNAWFQRHNAQLSQELPRAVYLRLKFHKLEEAQKLLREAGIEYLPSPLAKREKYYSLLDPSVLDGKGRPQEAFRRKAYDGAYGYFYDGQPEAGKEVLTASLKKIKRRPILKRAEALEEFAFDGEMEFEYGDQELGRAMLELVAALPTGNDLLGPAIERARETLARGKG